MSESWPIVRPRILFSGLMTTAIASMATVNSTGVIPFFRAAAISSVVICRDASAIWIVPFVKEAIPVPEPPPDTEMRTSGWRFM